MTQLKSSSATCISRDHVNYNNYTPEQYVLIYIHGDLSHSSVFQTCVREHLTCLRHQSSHAIHCMHACHVLSFCQIEISQIQSFCQVKFPSKFPSIQYMCTICIITIYSIINYNSTLVVVGGI